MRSSISKMASRKLYHSTLHIACHLSLSLPTKPELATSRELFDRPEAYVIGKTFLAFWTCWHFFKVNPLDAYFLGLANVTLLSKIMNAKICRYDCLKDQDQSMLFFLEQVRMDTRAYQESRKEDEGIMIRSKAKSLTRVAADIREEDWVEKLKISGFLPEKRTVWILEGIIYYLTQLQAMQVLRIIADKCALTHTVLLADFMNKPSTTLSGSTFHFYSDWPDHLLPSIGFTHVKLSQIGDPDAHFGLLNDPLNLFNKLRRVPRSEQTHPEDGTPCCRLYLVEASGSPHQLHQGTLPHS
ncbi:putative S-adenosyl-L-methionine-dependent methyltransferase [Senna tora]|uniref:Putative S-adenosyl-L-methionine-dependent methyltransferase n=1 Tax=Senna tora TaxID=362788 RepID=A0A834U0W4_9FABA|nr:putative S-adenosyl-L-methionine-dependent methyltransferase [Senna tora]